MTDMSYRVENKLAVRLLEDVTLIYHPGSGQTHMVTSPVPEILAIFTSAEEPLSADALLDRLAHAFDLGNPVEARAAVMIHLDEMTALGLVHRG
jgi:PqqD family protein of HPr-rel-A system